MHHATDKTRRWTIDTALVGPARVGSLALAPIEILYEALSICHTLLPQDAVI